MMNNFAYEIGHAITKSAGGFKSVRSLEPRPSDENTKRIRLVDGLQVPVPPKMRRHVQIKRDPLENALSWWKRKLGIA